MKELFSGDWRDFETSGMADPAGVISSEVLIATTITALTIALAGIALVTLRLAARLDAVTLRSAARLDGVIQTIHGIEGQLEGATDRTCRRLDALIAEITDLSRRLERLDPDEQR